VAMLERILVDELALCALKTGIASFTSTCRRIAADIVSQFPRPLAAAPDVSGH
jgi:hypothetical protein